jgi:hypothetical protein
MEFEVFNSQKHLSEVLDLFKTSLKNTGNNEWFQWKHMNSPFGSSYGFIATEDQRIIGARFFMKWELQLNSSVIHAIRPVDTVTHPSSRGKGIFTKLTMHAINRLHRQDQLVFNTPNSSSLPGYLKMGWKLYSRTFLHGYFFVNPFTKTPGIEIKKAILPDDVPNHLYTQGVAETLKSQSFVVWRYGTGHYQFSKFTGQNSALLVFKLIRRKGVKIMLIKDFVGRDSVKKILIAATAKRLSAYVVHSVQPSFLETGEPGFILKKGVSNVALRAPEDMLRQNFYFSPGDLEGII